MRQFMSEGGEGSWLDLFSFMKAGGEQYAPLKNIYECSKIQNELLDELIDAVNLFKK